MKFTSLSKHLDKRLDHCGTPEFIVALIIANLLIVGAIVLSYSIAEQTAMINMEHSHASVPNLLGESGDCNQGECQP